MIESAMQNMHFRVLEKAAGLAPGNSPTINPTNLARILSSYGLPHSEKEVNRILTSCSQDIKLNLLNLETGSTDEIDNKSDDYYMSRVNTGRSGMISSLGGSDGGEARAGGSSSFVAASGGYEEGKEDRGGGEGHASLALGNGGHGDGGEEETGQSQSVPYDSFLTSMAFWEMIAVSSSDL